MPPSPGTACRNCRYSDEGPTAIETPCPTCHGKGEVIVVEASGVNTTVRCETCGGSKVVMAKGLICRRYAPRTRVPEWPLMLTTDWCGEYDPRPAT